MITPSFEELEALAVEHRTGLVPITIELLADTLTPVSAFLLLTAGESGPVFLLESVEGGEHMGRYSFIGMRPSEVVALHADESDPLAAVARLAAAGGAYHPTTTLPRFAGGAVGWLGYEAVTAFEQLPRARGRPYGGLPDGVFARFDTIAAFDHLRHMLTLITHVRLDAANRADAYRRAVARLDELRARLQAPLGPSGARPRPPTDHACRSSRPRTSPATRTRPLSSAPKNTSVPATSSRSCRRSASPARRAPTP